LPKQVWNNVPVSIDVTPRSPSLLQTLRRRLSSRSDTPYLDAQVLLSHILETDRAWILAHPDPDLTSAEREKLADSLHQLEQGVPLPYVLGHRAFFGLDFELTPSVLIPRPETELLVERALTWLKEHPQRRTCADIGTGSGCIAVSLVVQVPDLAILAVDLAPDILEVARANAVKHDVAAQIKFRESDLFANVETSFDLICANLPYIPTATLKTLKVYHREPEQALDGGPGGLQEIKRLLKTLPAHMKPGGLALLEIDASQGAETLRLAQEQFPSAEVTVCQDLSGKDRLLSIQEAP
jgi:release factor glutamine methyltransferase